MDYEKRNHHIDKYMRGCIYWKEFVRCMLHFLSHSISDVLSVHGLFTYSDFCRCVTKIWHLVGKYSVVWASATITMLTDGRKRNLYLDWLQTFYLIPADILLLQEKMAPQCGFSLLAQTSITRTKESMKKEARKWLQVFVHSLPKSPNGRTANKWTVHIQNMMMNDLYSLLLYLSTVYN